MIHDFWKPYYNSDCTHSRCNVHNVRELSGIYELTGQNWGQGMIDLLLDIKERVCRMVKVKQKMSGVFHSGKGANMFCRICGYILIARKDSLSTFAKIIDALESNPLGQSFSVVFGFQSSGGW